MKQTVVEFLVEALVQECGLDEEGDMAKYIIEQAKEIEKQQELKKWIETWSLGYNSGFDNCNKKYDTKQQEQ